MSDTKKTEMWGHALENDRRWLIHTEKFSGLIAEYNDELTGFDPRFIELDPKAFVYGGNAYYILRTLCHRRGWQVEESDL